MAWGLSLPVKPVREQLQLQQGHRGDKAGDTSGTGHSILALLSPFALLTVLIFLTGAGLSSALWQKRDTKGMLESASTPLCLETQIWAAGCLQEWFSFPWRFRAAGLAADTHPPPPLPPGTQENLLHSEKKKKKKSEEEN